MKNLAIFATALIITLLLAVFVNGNAQAASYAIYKTLTGKQLAQLMQKFGVDPDLTIYEGQDSVEDYPIIPWIIDDQTTLVNVADNGTRIEFYVYLETKHQNILERVNEWNKNRFYSRSHVDDDGDPVLELELDLAGGVTEARIEDFFKTCLRSYRDWRSVAVN